MVELARRGRQLVGEPYFTPGVPVAIDSKGLAGRGEGELALVVAGRGRARFERGFGSAKEIENVLAALLAETGVRCEHDEPFELPEPPLEDRVDLRELPTVTIDPETAKDFDDALSLRREPDGIRAWVHIADVAAYVPSGSPLDREAALRGCSTYVPGLVAPMLPPELADDLCSLRPRFERMCVTVEMPARGEPLFYRSLIRSDARLTYSQAERREAPTAIVEQLELAGELSAALRRARFERGALDIRTPELGFDIRGGRVGAAHMEAEPYAHMLVEELMIRANENVAAFLASRRRRALFRVHERPEPRSIELLVEKLAALEVPTPPLPDRLSPELAAELAATISREVRRYVDQAGRGVEAFPALVLRALKQARYNPSNLGHSGLASTAYCHFTSPIRRYPDLVVHRALLAELGLEADTTPAELGELAEHTSLREREASSVEYQADAICLAWLLEDTLYREGWESVFEGEITGLIGSGLFARFGGVFEGFLPARRLPGEFFELNDTGTALVGRRSGRSYRLGDRLTVRVDSISRGEGKVELSLGAASEAGSPPRRPPRR